MNLVPFAMIVASPERCSPEALMIHLGRTPTPSYPQPVESLIVLSSVGDPYASPHGTPSLKTILKVISSAPCQTPRNSVAPSLAAMSTSRILAHCYPVDLPRAPLHPPSLLAYTVSPLSTLTLRLPCPRTFAKSPPARSSCLSAPSLFRAWPTVLLIRPPDSPHGLPSP